MTLTFEAIRAGSTVIRERANAARNDEIGATPGGVGELRQSASPISDGGPNRLRSARSVDKTADRTVSM